MTHHPYASNRSPVALVTGGAGDIGSAVGAALCADGYTVLLTDLLAPAEGDVLAERVAHQAVVPMDRVSYARLDVTDPEQTRAVLAGLPAVDVMVVNAGIVAAQPFLEIDVATWRKHLEVNLTGAFISAQTAARIMVDRGTRGLIVFTSSWVATRPWPGIAAYSSTKAGLDQLMRQLALELAPYGVRANAVAPGIVRAGMAKRQLDEEPDYAARAARSVPLGELQTASQIADAVAFLASPRAATMDGTVLLLDAGCSLGTVE